MKVNIYYGGRGLVDDPTIFVIDKVQKVLEELNVSVERFNLYEIKNAITTLPQTLKSADGIILATTVEWFGIGGFLQSFLDAIWLYGDKEQISRLYMMPVVMSTTVGEKEAMVNLSLAWELLGGPWCNGVCGYIKDMAVLENNRDYLNHIEKKAENFYRSIHQKLKNLPASNPEAYKAISVHTTMDLTPQETEQLSRYASDEVYVQKQKEDIQELASYFKGMLSTSREKETGGYQKQFEEVFQPQPGCKTVYCIRLEGETDVLQLQVDQNHLVCSSEETKKTDIEMSMSEEVLKEIISGHETFQKAFMTGDMKMKGDFTQFRILDELFPFNKNV